MELLWLLPFVFIVIGAFYTVRMVRTRKPSISLGQTIVIWAVVIVVPFIFQILTVSLVRRNELSATKLDWVLVDVFRVRLSMAQYLDDVVFRTIGVIVAFVCLVGVIKCAFRKELAIGLMLTVVLLLLLSLIGLAFRMM